MSDMFEYLEAQAQEENIPFKNAAIVSIDRAERRFSSFLSAAQGDKEFQSRLALISDEIQKIADDVCDEQGYEDAQHVAKLVVGQLELLSARNSDSSDTDGLGNIERQTLKPMDPSGYYTDPTVALNPGSAGDNMKNTNPSIPELKPFDHQHPDDLSYPNDGALPKANLVDADKPMQPADHHGDSTMTFPNKGQADPVTSSKKKSEAISPAEVSGREPMGIDWSGFGQNIKKMLQPGSPEHQDALQQAKNAFAEGMDLPSVRSKFPDLGMDEPALRKLQQEALGEAQSEKIRGMQWANDFGGFNSSIKEAAERMDFNSISEMMTPSEAVSHLRESGMEEHEASDRIYWYVNHVNPGWANKNWTAAAEDGEPDAGGDTTPDLIPEEEYTPADQMTYDRAVANVEQTNINVPPDQQGTVVGLTRDKRSPYIVYGPQEGKPSKPSSQYQGLYHGAPKMQEDEVMGGWDGELPEWVDIDKPYKRPGRDV